VQVAVIASEDYLIMPVQTRSSLRLRMSAVALCFAVLAAAGGVTVAAGSAGGTTRLAPAAAGAMAVVQSPGMHLAVPAQLGPTALTPGCNQVTVVTVAGTSLRSLAANVSVPGAVAGIWRFNNATQRYLAGYFDTTAAPVDITATRGGSESFFICVRQPATYTPS